MSTTKRKVQFNSKKKVKKFSRDEGEDDSASDYEKSDEEFAKPKAKHSLDSDEEDNADKYDLLNQECLNGCFIHFI